MEHIIEDGEVILRRTSHTFTLADVIVKNSKGDEVHLFGQGEEVLKKFPEGKFNNQDYEVKRGTVGDYIDDNDYLEIKQVVYKGVRTNACGKRPTSGIEILSYEEYVELGRKETITVEESKVIRAI